MLAPGTSVTGDLLAFVIELSIASGEGAGPTPSKPFSECSITAQSAGTKLATSVGSPLPKLTIPVFGRSCAARQAMACRLSMCMAIIACDYMIDISPGGCDIGRRDLTEIYDPGERKRVG